MINNLQRNLRLIPSVAKRLVSVPDLSSPSLSSLRRGATHVAGALMLALVVGSPNATRAATFTWSGDSSTNQLWSNGANWAGIAPLSSNTTDLVFAGTTNTGTSGSPLNNDIATPFVLNSITFNSGGGAFFLGGTSLQFSAGLNDTITQSSSSAETIANTITASGKPLNNTETITLTGNGSGVVTLSGTILAGNGQRDYAITKSGTSTYVLSGANTYGGATTVSTGILNIQNNTALGGTGSGTSVASGATLQIQNGITVGAEGLTLNGTGATGQNGALVNVSGTNNYGGLVTLGSATTISSDSGTLNLTNTGTITGSGNALTLTGSGDGSVSSVIGTGAGTLTKSGSGSWTLTGASTYSGGTTVSAGTLFVNNTIGSGTGTGTVTVNGTGTLGGSGTITGAVNVSASGAKINAGGTAGAVGTLATGALTLSSASVMSVDMTSTTADQISVTGAVNITSASLQLNIPNGTVFTAGQSFTLINNDLADAISGTFSNAPTGTDLIDGYYWVVAYNGGTGNDFVITAVPEPSTWLAAALALGAIGFAQRKRLRACASSAVEKHSNF
jgi:autotransporter-associated beta strand repeat